MKMASLNLVKSKYTENQLQQALAEVKNGMKLRQASKMFGVPSSTLHDKLKGKSVNKLQHSGLSSCLGVDKENELVLWLMDCSKKGFPITKKLLEDAVQKPAIKLNIKTQFKNNKPGRKWFEKFMPRHKNLSIKRAEYINKARGSVTEANIRKWFEEVVILLGSDATALANPKQVYNMDETGFFLAPTGDRIIGPKGATVYAESVRSDKENVTTLFTVNAEGEFGPPLTLYKYARMPSSIVKQAAKINWAVGRSETGWINSECFFEYIANVFVPYLNGRSISRPVVVFLDGHKSHLSQEVSELCRENGIVLVALFPNATHILQPLDVAVFGPMKKKWNGITKKWLLDHNGREKNKADVPEALNAFLSDPVMPQNIISGFRCTGIYS